MEEVPWPENCQRAYVTHVESPNAIFVRDEFLEKKWQEHENWMIAQMFDYLKQKQKEPILSSKLLNKSVMVKDQGLFYRGQVLSVDAEKKKLTVRLVDFGKVVQANIKDVKPLPHKLKKIRPLCYCVSMADVIPTGTSDKSKWSLKAIEYCQDVLPRLEFLMLQPKVLEISREKIVKFLKLNLFRQIEVFILISESKNFHEKNCQILKVGFFCLFFYRVN